MKTFVVDSIYFTFSFFFMAARAEPIRSASSLTRGCSASSLAFCVTGCHSTGGGTVAFIYLYIWVIPFRSYEPAPTPGPEV